MVECVVSINQMFAEQRLERRCQELEESNEVHYKNVTHKDETFRKGKNVSVRPSVRTFFTKNNFSFFLLFEGTKCCASLALVFLLLLAIFAWQSIVPGTAYRYWWCQLGSKSTMERIQFKYKPSGTIDVWILICLIFLVRSEHQSTVCRNKTNVEKKNEK